MSLIDTYRKYNLHSAASYIEGNVWVCKKQGRGKTFEGETSGKETSGGGVWKGGGNVLHPRRLFRYQP